jgi:hypothetical protein
VLDWGHVSAQSGLTWSGRDCRAWTHCPRGAPAVQCSAVQSSAVQRSMAYRAPHLAAAAAVAAPPVSPLPSATRSGERPVPCGEGCQEAAEGQSSYPLSQRTNAQTLDGKPI